MIKTITVTNAQNETMVINLSESATELGLLIANMDGLGSPIATVNTLGSPNIPGTRFNSAKAQQRNIVLTVIVTAKGALEEITRTSLYKYFPSTEWIRFLVTTDTKEAYINAVVENNNVKMFVEHENTEVSLICPKPYFIGLEEEVVVFSGTQPLFEFPFSNESLTEDLIIFGEELSYVNRVINYTGDAQTGVTIRMHCTGPVAPDGVITVYNTTYREEMNIDTSTLAVITGFDLDLGDDIVINTTPGEKEVYVERSGVRWNILNAMDFYSDWISLRRGNNAIAYGATEGIDNLEMRITYHNLYEGV